MPTSTACPERQSAPLETSYVPCLSWFGLAPQIPSNHPHLAATPSSGWTDKHIFFSATLEHIAFTPGTIRSGHRLAKDIGTGNSCSHHDCNVFACRKEATLSRFYQRQGRNRILGYMGRPLVCTARRDPSSSRHQSHMTQCTHTQPIARHQGA